MAEDTIMGEWNHKFLGTREEGKHETSENVFRGLCAKVVVITFISLFIYHLFIIYLFIYVFIYLFIYLLIYLFIY